MRLAALRGAIVWAVGTARRERRYRSVQERVQAAFDAEGPKPTFIPEEHYPSARLPEHPPAGQIGIVRTEVRDNDGALPTHVQTY